MINNSSAINSILRIEELALFLLGFYFFYILNITWYWLLIGLLLPDISMIGYLHSPKLGAFTYNIAHNRIVAIGCYFAGVYLNILYLEWVGLFLFVHVAMDRVLKYGLKYSDSFCHTHLGNIKF